MKTIRFSVFLDDVRLASYSDWYRAFCVFSDYIEKEFDGLLRDAWVYPCGAWYGAKDPENDCAIQHVLKLIVED